MKQTCTYPTELHFCSVVAKMKAIVHVLACTVAMIIVSSATKVQKCGGDQATALPTVDFGDCNGEDRCVLYRGDTYDFTVKFKAPAAADKLEAMVVGKAFGQEVIVKSGQDDEVCKSVSRRDKKGKKGEQCPLKKGTQYIYDKPVKIDENEFQLRLTPEFRFMDGNNKTISCFKFPLQVKRKD